MSWSLSVSKPSTPSDSATESRLDSASGRAPKGLYACRETIAIGLTAEFSVKRLGRAFDAVITSEGSEVARVIRQQGGRYELEGPGAKKWELDPRVGGEIMPFSMTVTAPHDEVPVLTVVRGVFLYETKFYMFMGVPEDVEPKESLLDGRHIIRLDGLPFSTLEEMDKETWGRLKRLRGVSVAQVSGMGIEQHIVRVSDELSAIGVILAAVSYLLYATG